jgi:hypothetical protein
MQLARATGTAALVLLLGAIVPAYGQHGKQNEEQGKERGQQRSQPQARHEQTQRQQPQRERAQETRQLRPQQQRRAQETRQQRPQQQRRVQETRQQRPQQHRTQRPQQARQQHPRRTRQEATAWQQKRGWLQHGGWEGHGSWQQSRTRDWARVHRTWAQRGGYGGYYIPQARFNLYFGMQHWFRLHSRPTIYMGYPRFSYGGYSFILVDPWPAAWPENWYEADDLYIGYNDGYYLYNRRYPGIALAISVVM